MCLYHALFWLSVPYLFLSVTFLVRLYVCQYIMFHTPSAQCSRPVSKLMECMPQQCVVVTGVVSDMTRVNLICSYCCCLVHCIVLKHYVLSEDKIACLLLQQPQMFLFPLLYPYLILSLISITITSMISPSLLSGPVLVLQLSSTYAPLWPSPVETCFSCNGVLGVLKLCAGMGQDIHNYNHWFQVVSSCKFMRNLLVE